MLGLPFKGSAIVPKGTTGVVAPSTVPSIFNIQKPQGTDYTPTAPTADQTDKWSGMIKPKPDMGYVRGIGDIIRAEATTPEFAATQTKLGSDLAAKGILSGSAYDVQAGKNVADVLSRAGTAEDTEILKETDPATARANVMALLPSILASAKAGNQEAINQYNYLAKGIGLPGITDAEAKTYIEPTKNADAITKDYGWPQLKSGDKFTYNGKTYVKTGDTSFSPLKVNAPAPEFMAMRNWDTSVASADQARAAAIDANTQYNFGMDDAVIGQIAFDAYNAGTGNDYDKGTAALKSVQSYMRQQTSDPSVIGGY